MDKPTIGRVVHYHGSDWERNTAGTGRFPGIDGPLAAIIVGVVNDGKHVNLTVCDGAGNWNPRLSVEFVPIEQANGKSARAWWPPIARSESVLDSGYVK